MEDAVALDALEQGCLGRDAAWGMDAPFCAPREIAVKTATLCALEKSLEDERHYLQTSALLVSGQRQEDSCKQRARRITAIVACLRAEITARANPSQRNPGEAQRFDDYLQRALEIHLELEPTNNAMQEPPPREYRPSSGCNTRSTGNAGITAKASLMNKESALLQRFLYALNDSSALFRRLAAKTASSHLKLLLERAIRTHQWIADDLARRMTSMGGSPKCHGSTLGPLRALYGNWLARTTPDLEQACATQALRSEDAALQLLDGAIADAMDGELRNLLQTRGRLMDGVRTQIECFRPPLPMAADGDLAPRRLTRVTLHPSAYQAAAPAHRRVRT